MGEIKVLEVNNLVKNYQKSASMEEKDEIRVLKGLDFEVREGEFVGFLGKSGCG